MIYFTAHTFKCVCHCRRAMFRVLGMYNFDNSETIVNFCFRVYFLCQNRLKTHMKLWVAPIEIAYRVTYIHNSKDFEQNVWLRAVGVPFPAYSSPFILCLITNIPLKHASAMCLKQKPSFSIDLMFVLPTISSLLKVEFPSRILELQVRVVKHFCC